MMKALAIAILLGMSAPVASAQAPEERQTSNTLRLTPGTARPAATLADMAWLVGRWKGTGLGGVSEEIWADPLGGVMMGMYRLVIDGKPSFYEFMHLSEEQGSLVLKLKHFKPDLTAWEEKDRFVTFPLVKLGTKEAFFSGLTFRLTPEGRLEILLALQQNGKVREEPFDLAIGAIHRREFVPRDPDCRISSVGACRDGRRWDQDYSRRERQGMSGERFPAVRSERG